MVTRRPWHSGRTAVVSRRQRGGDRNGHHATPAATAGPESASPRTSTTACRPLRLGAAARAHLCSVSAALSALRSLDADRRLHHRTHYGARDPRPPRRADPPTYHRTGSRLAIPAHLIDRTLAQ